MDIDRKKKNKNRGWPFGCLLVGVFIIYSSCSCTEAGCLGGFRLSLSKSDLEPFKLGRYVVSVTENDLSYTCNVLVETNIYSSCEGSFEPNSFNFLFVENPDFVSLEIEFEESIVFDEELHPTYVKFAPNGESCDPICHSASERFEITM